MHAARLDLGEHERCSVEHDQVDLAMAGARVAREHRVAEPDQVGSRQLLAEASERAACVGRAAPGRWAGEALWRLRGVHDEDTLGRCL